MLNRHVIKKAVEHHIGRDVARRYRQSEDDQRHARSLHRRCGCCARFRGLSPDLREGDQCARLGDFAPDCDNEGAGEIAGAVLDQLSEGMPLVGAPFSVSIGIALHDGAGADFAGMHREADTALHQAPRAEIASPCSIHRPRCFMRTRRRKSWCRGSLRGARASSVGRRAILCATSGLPAITTGR
jgi:GGDEF domain-containing protein